MQSLAILSFLLCFTAAASSACATADARGSAIAQHPAPALSPQLALNLPALTTLSAWIECYLGAEGALKCEIAALRRSCGGANKGSFSRRILLLNHSPHH